VTNALEALVPARLGRSYRWLLASSWTTNLGDGITAAAGPLLIASMTDDPFLVAVAVGLNWAPQMVFGLYAGALSDRLDRQRIMLVGNAARIVVLAALVVALAVGHISVYGVLVALGLLATAEVFVDGTATTLMPMLVHRDDLALANARLQTGYITFNQLIGPPIGAALFAAGRTWPFVGEGLLLLAGLLLLWRIRLPGFDYQQRERTLRHDIVEGFRWTVRHPAVRTLALTILIFNVTFGAAWSVLVLYAQQRLGLGAFGFGLLTTVGAVGGLAGTALYGWLTRRVSLGNIMRAGLIIETLTHLGLAVTTTGWVAMAIMFMFGAHVFIWGTTSTTIRQRAVPTHLQGRIGSVYRLCVYGGLVAGTGVGGGLASRYGVTAPLWFAFAGSAVFVVLLWRQLSHIAHADAQAGPLSAATSG
jgi:MFS family permease